MTAAHHGADRPGHLPAELGYVQQGKTNSPTATNEYRLSRWNALVCSSATSFMPSFDKQLRPMEHKKRHPERQGRRARQDRPRAYRRPPS